MSASAGEPSARDDLTALLAGDEAALSRWAASGQAGLRALRQAIDGTSPVPLDLVDPQRWAEAIVTLAEREPDRFLATFSAPHHRCAPGVVTGLGVIDRPAATRRLLAGVADDDPGIRADAAVGLGNRTGEDVEVALARAADDEDPVVRQRALHALARVATPRSDSVLAAVADDGARPDGERQLAGAARTLAAERARLDDDPGAQIRLALSIGDVAGARRWLPDDGGWPRCPVPPDGRSLLEVAEEVGDPSARALLDRAARRVDLAD